MKDNTSTKMTNSKNIIIKQSVLQWRKSIYSSYYSYLFFFLSSSFSNNTSFITSNHSCLQHVNAFSTYLNTINRHRPLGTSSTTSVLCNNRNSFTSSSSRSSKGSLCNFGYNNPNVNSHSNLNFISSLQLSSFSSGASSNNNNDNNHDDHNYRMNFRQGDLIQVEVVRFGPLGASVEIIAHNSHSEQDWIPEEEEPLGYGLILQSEIGYFRSSRGGLDVVKGEILPAYVQWVREDGKVDITLRKPGGKGKADDLGKIILEKLKQTKDNEIPIGDKSSPHDINEMFPGASKASFKRAVAALYKKRLVQPGPHHIKLL